MEVVSGDTRPRTGKLPIADRTDQSINRETLEGVARPSGVCVWRLFRLTLAQRFNAGSRSQEKASPTRDGRNALPRSGEPARESLRSFQTFVGGDLEIAHPLIDEAVTEK